MPAGRRLARVLLPLFALAWVGFIFWNSAKPGEVSGQASQAVVSVLTGQPAPTGDTTLEWLVRKAGHLGEYALLGLLLWLSLAAWGRKRWAWRAAALLAGVAVAAGDEAFQLGIPGRSGQISDVAIDAVGLLLGFALGALALWVLPERKQ